MVATIDRCLSLMETLAHESGGLSLGELADRLDLPKSATHRMLATLLERGYVRQDAETQAYALSLRLALLAFRYLDLHQLPDVAQTVLEALARESGEYCRLAVVEGEGLVWIARAQGATLGLRYDPEMGQEVMLHATATGKAWLATLPEAEALRIVSARGFRRPTHAGKRGVSGVIELRQQLAETRRRGYGLAVEEAEAGIVALAVAFRAWDSSEAPVAGTLSVAGPVVRIRKERYEELSAALARAARDVSAVWPLHRRQRPIVVEDGLQSATVRSRRSPGDGVARGAAK